jgi:hypothetical protein
MQHNVSLTAVTAVTRRTAFFDQPSETNGFWRVIEARTAPEQAEKRENREERGQ